MTKNFQGGNDSILRFLSSLTLRHVSKKTQDAIVVDLDVRIITTKIIAFVDEICIIKVVNKIPGF